MPPSDLRQTLVMMIDAVRDAQDPWWGISSAAVALHGVTPIEVRDVDVLMSVGDAQQLMDALGVVPIEDGESLVVEIMAEFHVATADVDRGFAEDARADLRRRVRCLCA
jgi:hypothetical protein